MLNAKTVFTSIGGRGVALSISLMLIPVYIFHVGVEGYGVISAILLLQTFSGIFEGGLSQTISREIAVNKIKVDAASGNLGGIIKASEIAVVVGAGLLCSILVGAMLVYGQFWIKATTTDSAEIKVCFLLMGIIVFNAAYGGFLHGGLQGLERQTDSNIIISLSCIFRLIFVALFPFIIIWKTAAIFLAIATSSIVETAAVRFVLLKKLPINYIQSAPSWGLLFSVRDMAISSWAIALTALAKSHGDRFVASSMVDMKNFGAYSLMTAVYQTVLSGVYPIANAAWPTIARSYSSGNLIELLSTIRKMRLLILVGGFIVILLSLVINASNPLYLRLSKYASSDLGKMLPVFVGSGFLAGFATVPHLTILASNHQKNLVFLNVIQGAVGVLGTFLCLKSAGVVALAIFQNFLNLVFLWALEYSAFQCLSRDFRYSKISCDDKRMYLACALAGVIPNLILMILK